MSKNNFLVILFLPLLIVFGEGVFAQKTNKVFKRSKNNFSDVFAYCDEVPAHFVGGDSAWKIFLKENTIYPVYQDDFQGIVKVLMTISVDGSVCHVKALNNPGKAFRKEAVRVIMQSPKWIPATLHGKKIPYRFIQRITFMLE